MRYCLVIFAFWVLALKADAQNNTLTVSGGYATTRIKDADQNANGWRLYGVYEIRPVIGNVVHGFALSYVRSFAEVTQMSGSNTVTSNFTVTSWPFYYVPKLIIGKGSLKGFVKAAAGMQFSNLKRTGTLPDAMTKDAGLYGGLGAGVTKTLNRRHFINLEYEWGYMTNSFYANGIMHSIMLGFGFYLD